jgi:Zn-dependent protease
MSKIPSKRLHELTPEDFRAYPVWEYGPEVEGESGDRETWVWSVEQHPVTDLSSRFIGTTVTLNNGMQLPACLGNVALQDEEATQALLALNVWHQNEWVGLRCDNDTGEPQSGEESFARQLGLTMDEVFPMHYDIAAHASGLKSVVRGTIEAHLPLHGAGGLQTKQHLEGIVEMQEHPLTSLPSGSVAVPVEEHNASEAPVDPFEESVLAELEKIRNPKGNWIQALLILAVSLLLFVGLGMRNNAVAFTVMLVGVLLFHEMGHYVGMRVFGYRNVRMFFIPFFGAAVSGQKTDVKSYQEAIVTLLGPLPGLCLSVMLLGVTLVPGIGNEARRNVLWASVLFGLINGFNLLPVFPLDGGRLLNQILFSRNRYLEGVFQVMAALAFVAYGVAHERFFLCVVGGLFLTSIGPRFKMNTIAQGIGSRLGHELPPMNAPIPLLIVRGIVTQVKSLLPKVNTAKRVAGVVFNVWEKMHVRPPSAVATVSLLLVYLLGSAVALVPYLATNSVIHPPTGSNSVELQIERFASDMNKRLPQQIDEFTRWERVEPGPGKSYSYVYTVSKDLTEEQKREGKEIMTRRMLANADMQATFAAGITIWLKYYDPSGRKVLGFPVKK